MFEVTMAILLNLYDCSFCTSTMAL